ncbi:MAG: tRNA (adenosine(37)-N6)-dimethylallyltransferase MiaA [Cytophagaceae bacterium]|jgi:tRNA dimethylallyltransferase|nr:tRNA (adenosine(37)-N6)-dimethylallyltransferase MiaA [Cytophagaceae bacterium]
MSQVSKKYLVCIIGPTAVGKTTLSIELAKWYNTEIISADSRQLFKELTIGTAKPLPQEQRGIRHHFIDSHSISDYFSAGIFEREASEILKELFKRNDRVVLCGGTGLYVQALINGLDSIPEVDPSVRLNLEDELQKHGLEALVERLSTFDPSALDTIDVHNPRRVLRALEVFYSTGLPITAYQKGEKKKLDYIPILIGLTLPREELYQRIDQRMELMLERGLEDEVRQCLPYRTLNALQTVGYKEVFDYFDGNYSREEMIRLLKRNSRHYAKRQLTWFRRMEGLQWFHPQEIEKIKQYIESFQ